MNFKQHKEKWIDCTRCPLHENRNRVVLARGTIPAPILFIGEAPGESEDVLGKPFVGPAGKLLDSIIEQSIDGQWDYCITNLVGCIPKEDGKKAGEPPDEAIDACRERLIEMIKLAKPRLLVLVGLLSGKFVPVDSYTRGIKRIRVIHPAAILRMNIAAQPLEIKKAIATISDAVDELGEE